MLAQSYIDDTFVYSREENGWLDVDKTKHHVQSVLKCMRTDKLFDNASKCIIGSKNPFLDRFL